MDAFFSILQCPMNVSQVSQKSYNNNAIKYFRAVAGVTLPKADSEFPAGSAAEVSGWGVTDAGDAADVLMLVAVHIDSDEGRFKFTMTVLSWLVVLDRTNKLTVLDYLWTKVVIYGNLVPTNNSDK